MPTNQVVTYVAKGGAKTRRGQFVPPPPPGIIEEDFEGLTVTNPITLANWRTALHDSTIGSAPARTQVLNAFAAPYGKTLSTTLLADSDGSANGIAHTVKIPKTVDHATMEYWVRWHTDFEWSGGGKIPGLAGYVPLSGGSTPASITSPPSGGAPNWFGFGARGMWIKDSYGGDVSGGIEIVGYVYHPALSYSTYGVNAHTNTGIGTEGGFSNGNWWKFKQEIKMNTATNSKLQADWTEWNTTPDASKGSIAPSVVSGTDYLADGIHRIWVNDVLTTNITNRVWRFYPEVHINRAQWSIFRGGNSSGWWSSTTGRIDIANYLVYEVFS